MSTMVHVDIGQMVFGGVIALACLTVLTARRRWRGVLSCAPRRNGPLDLVHLSVLVLVFMLAMQALNYLGTRIEPPAGFTAKQWIGGGDRPGFWPILASSASKLFIAGLVVVLAAVAIEGGLKSFGLGAGRLGRDLAWGVLGYLMIWPACMGLAQLIVLLTGNPPTHGVINLLHSGALPQWGKVTLWVCAVLAAPVAEEVFFRGMLQTVARGYIDRPWLAIGLASVAFGMMHFSQPQFVLPLTVLGVALGYVYERTGSLIAPILLHILFNSRTMLVYFLLEQR